MNDNRFPPDQGEDIWLNPEHKKHYEKYTTKLVNIPKGDSFASEAIGDVGPSCGQTPTVVGVKLEKYPKMIAYTNTHRTTQIYGTYPRLIHEYSLSKNK